MPDHDRTDLRDRPLVRAAIDRAMSARVDAAADEIARIVEAAYRVIERTDDVDPKMRAILKEAGLSTQAFYRHFPSKDDLLLVLLDDGRRRLADYLEHRMAKATTPRTKVRAWIDGMLAQAVDADAASRTRPFVTNLGRLAELHPEEQRASAEALVRLLLTAIDDERDAWAIYHMASSCMQSHVLARTTPTKAEIEGLCSFAERALGLRSG